MPDTATASEITEPDTTTTHRTGHRAVPGWLSSPWLTITALALAVVATGLAITAWFDPLHSTYSDQQIAQAKKSVCAAYATVHQGVVTNTHLVNPTPNNPAGQLAVAANARLALLGGGALLRDRLASQPATPHDIAAATATLADTIEDLGAQYLAGSDAPLSPLRHTLDTTIAQLNSLCR